MFACASVGEVLVRQAAAARMIEDGTLSGFVDERYAGWNGEEGRKLLAGELTLTEATKLVESREINPRPRSGRQEYLENVVNRYV